jgi:tetratricopeptide (TPR) repeat protein
MAAARRSISADFDHVHAQSIQFGDNYYGSAERPTGLHVGVPPMPAHFVGREPLVADVARRLVGGSRPALSAEGLPGVGKTTLAVALAHRREILDHFTDGVLWGGLGLQPNVMEVLASWASALGIDVSEETDPAERARLVRNAIGQRRFFLVIDDAWAPADNALLLKCGGPGCAHFLTTGDESITRAFAGRQGAVELRELAPEHALELLTALAPEACEADPEAAAGLVKAVGYLPLAIELMGAYLSEAENRYFREQQEAAMRRMADPAERLRQACERLGDFRGTEVTLGETIGLSLHGLPDDAVAAFHALGAFAPRPETFDLAAATAVTGASPATLSRLIERHLLEKQGDALSLHQTIADAARVETPADAVQAHASHYLARIIEAGSDWKAIEAVYGQATWGGSRLRDAGRILALTDALRQYQTVRGLREDGLRWSDLEIEAARAAGDRQREATALSNRGWLHNRLGERDRALEFYRQALPIRRAVGDRQGEAVTLNNIGSVYDRLGERDRALGFYHQALPIRRAVGDRQGEAVTLNNIGSVYDSLGERGRALEFYQQALPILRDAGDRQGEAATLNNIGRAYGGLGDHDRALEFYRQALSVAQAAGDRQGEAVTLINIGYVHSRLGEHDRALELYQQALPILRDVGDRQGEAVTLNNIGLIYDGLGERARALEFFQRAVPIMRAVGSRAFELVTRYNIATIHRAEGRLEEAVAELRQVIELEIAVRHPDLESDRQLLAKVEAELAEKNRQRDER